MVEIKHPYATRKKLRRMIFNKKKQLLEFQKEILDLEVALQETEDTIELRKQQGK